MAEAGLLDVEQELQCAICTGSLYQPLTLLDCLHTFCGGCVKEWFTWQAAAAATASSSRRQTSPYTCPQCREHVRDTKADWRTTTLLEGFLKANPGKGKSDEEKAELRRRYTPGDNVLPPVAPPAYDSDSGSDSEDERLLAHVRHLSMANVDPEAARRRAERAGGRRPNERPGERQHERPGERQHERPGERQHERPVQLPNERPVQRPNERPVQRPNERPVQRPNERPAQRQNERPVQRQNERTAQRENERQVQRPNERQVQRQNERPAQRLNERPVQPQLSLRSLLSDSDITSAHVQEDILQSISSDAMLDGIDIDHLTPAQEEELTERIAEAYRRRQRPRDGSRRREASAARHQPATDSRRNVQSPTPRQPSPLQHAHAPSRHPISRPHLLEQTSAGAGRNPRPSASSTTTQPTPQTELRGHSSRQPSRPERQQQQPSSGGNGLHSSHVAAQQSARPAISPSAFAREPRSTQAVFPSIACSRCHLPDLAETLHYNCSKCESGNFNLCLACYRDGRGCHHWFGFGLMAMYRYQRAQNESPEGYNPSWELPHVLSTRKYVRKPQHDFTAGAHNQGPTQPVLQEGAFCENCLNLTNDCYWYCEICLEGAWGYCNTCVLQGHHCTHPLLPLAHISTLSQALHHDPPSRFAFLPLPHLTQHAYFLLSVSTACTICRLPILPRATRFHCYACSDGDHDICTACYHSLAASGSISPSNGPDGWRRCRSGHRMAVIAFPDPLCGGARRRWTVRDMVGGWRWKEAALPSGGDAAALVAARPAAPPDDGADGVGYCCLASWSWWPAEENPDELAFPKNAEIRECEDRNADWSVGVYGGKVGLFPRNHTRKV